VSRHLKDPRLQQLFGRYATYVGSSPYQAVATLLLIAHVEQEGVWTVQGGMHAVARAFERVFKNKGGSIRYETSVRRIVTSGDRVRAVITAQGEEIPCRAVISNADANAIATGHFGDDVSHVVQELNKADRSLSAITWCSHAHTSGFPLAFHNVFFSKDYKREFEMLRQSYPPDPTTYICAQDRNGVVQDKERLLILINSPANGDSLEKNRDMIEQAMRKKLNECGLQIDWSSAETTITSPQGFHALFPATGGALYGRSSHGFYASFKRPGAKTKIPGLFLAGGSAHPGAGVPMAAYSGRLAADAVMDFLSSPSHHKGARFMQGES
jgi:1-hydroxycarotenoid 3,4-desaturase